MEAALLISFVSLALALFALSWQMYEAFRVDRARIVLEAEEKVQVREHREPVDVLRVSATNLGKRPTTINALWLGLGHIEHRWPWKLVPGRFRPAPKWDLCGQPIGYMGACDTIPCKLEPGDQINVLYTRETVEERLRETGFDMFFVQAFATTDEVATLSRRPNPERWDRARGRALPT